MKFEECPVHTKTRAEIEELAFKSNWRGYDYYSDELKALAFKGECGGLVRSMTGRMSLDDWEGRYILEH